MDVQIVYNTTAHFQTGKTSFLAQNLPKSQHGLAGRILKSDVLELISFRIANIFNLSKYCIECSYKFTDKFGGLQF